MAKRRRRQASKTSRKKGKAKRAQRKTGKSRKNGKSRRVAFSSRFPHKFIFTSKHLR